VATGGGGAYLRERGLCSSMIGEWRKLRDGGVPASKKPGEKVGKLRITTDLRERGEVVSEKAVAAIMAELGIEAITAGVAGRGGCREGIVPHSDRGGEFAAGDTEKACRAHGLRRWMGETGI
jgi:transposase InsO family protein